MNEADEQIIRLLTELRDMQREDIENRRRALEESVALQKSGIAITKRAMRTQRVALGVVIVGIAITVALFSVAKLLAER